MGDGERSGAARGSQEWKCCCGRENFEPESKEEWPIGKVLAQVIL